MKINLTELEGKQVMITDISAGYTAHPFMINRYGSVYQTNSFILGTIATVVEVVIINGKTIGVIVRSNNGKRVGLFALYGVEVTNVTDVELGDGRKVTIKNDVVDFNGITKLTIAELFKIQDSILGR